MRSIALLRGYGIKELVRTGTVVMSRGSQSIEEPRSDDGADVLRRGRRPGGARRPDGRDHRVREPGSRARPQPAGIGRGRGGGLPPTSKSRRIAEDAGLRVADVADAVRGADVVMILVPDTAQKAVFEADIAANLKPAPSSCSPTGSTFGSRGSARRPGSMSGWSPRRARPPGPVRLPGGRRRARAVRRGAGCHRHGACPDARLRTRDRRDAGRRPGDDVQGGDRDRPVRRAVRPVRRDRGPREDGLRDARQGRLPARAGLLRDAPRAQAHRGPDVPRRPQLHALQRQRHGRVRRLRQRSADHR